MKARGVVGHPLGKNPGDVWRLASSNYRGSHHATFPVALAELAIARYYTQLIIPGEVLDLIEERIQEALDDAQALTKAAHATLEAQLAKLDVQEERLLDLATDGDLPREKIRARLRELTLERDRLKAGLKDTTAELALGADYLRRAMKLIRSPGELYGTAPDGARGNLNTTFFERLFIDLFGEVEAELRPPFGELREAGRVWEAIRAVSGADEGETTPDMTTGPGVSAKACRSDLACSPNLGDLVVAGWSKRVMVGAAGFEPATNRL